MAPATDDRDRLRLRAQLLAGEPANAAAAVAERLLAVQAQDPRGFRLAVRARTTGLTVADVDRCLTEERSLVVSWLNRGTLHLVRSADYAWLHALTTPQLVTGNARRLRQEGVPAEQAERGVSVVRRALAADGPLTRADLRTRLDAAGVPTNGQALVHVLMLVTLRGIALRGPMVGSDQAYVLVEDWLGPQPAVDRDVALAELAVRYLVGHGPADDRDLARWAGLPLRDARAGLRAAGDRLVERPDGLVDLHARGPAAGQGTGRGTGRGTAGGAARRTGRRTAGGEAARPRLLGAFDPLLLGWVSRAGVLPVDGGVVTSNGLFRAVALVDGTGVATWALAGGEVVLSAFRPVPDEARRALTAEAADVLRFLGLPPSAHRDG